MITQINKDEEIKVQLYQSPEYKDRLLRSKIKDFELNTSSSKGKSGTLSVDHYRHGTNSSGSSVK